MLEYWSQTTRIQTLTFPLISLLFDATLSISRFLQSPNKIQKGQRGAKPQYKLPIEYREKREPVSENETGTSGITIKTESDDTSESSILVHEPFDDHEDSMDDNAEEEDSVCDVDDLGDDGFACSSISPAAMTECSAENSGFKIERPESRSNICENGVMPRDILNTGDRMLIQEIDSTRNSHSDSASNSHFLAPPLTHHLSMSDLGPYPRRGYRARSTDTQPLSPAFPHSPFLSRVTLSPPYSDVTDAHAVPHYRVLDSCPRSRSCEFAQSVQFPNYPFRPVQPRSVSPRLVVQSEPEDLSIRSRSDSSTPSASSREARHSVTDSDSTKCSTSS